MTLLPRWASLALLYLTYCCWLTGALVYPSGPQAGMPIAVAWGAGSLQRRSGYSLTQYESLAIFSDQQKLFVPDEYNTIWDFFPFENASQYPLTNGPFMQDPQDQRPDELVATACDTCARATSQNVIDIPASSSDWGVIWAQAKLAYQELLHDPSIFQNDNQTNFKMAMNWYNFASHADFLADSKTNSTIFPLNITLSNRATGSLRTAESANGAVCSTLYLEGLTNLAETEDQEIDTLLPANFQDLSVQCGCAFDSLAPGSNGSPFRGGWKVIMRGKTEAWRFRMESPGAACSEQAEQGNVQTS